MGDREVFDLYLLCKEEIELRANERETAIGKIQSGMLIREAKKLIGSDMYIKFIEEGKMFEQKDKVWLL